MKSCHVRALNPTRQNKLRTTSNLSINEYGWHYDTVAPRTQSAVHTRIHRRDKSNATCRSRQLGMAAFISSPAANSRKPPLLHMRVAPMQQWFIGINNGRARTGQAARLPAALIPQRSVQ